MDDMSWFGVMFYLTLFTIVYLVGLGIVKIAEYLDNKAYQDGYNDGFEDGVEEGIDITWDLAYREGRIEGMAAANTVSIKHVDLLPTGVVRAMFEDGGE